MLVALIGQSEFSPDRKEAITRALLDNCGFMPSNSLNQYLHQFLNSKNFVNEASKLLVETLEVLYSQGSVSEDNLVLTYELSPLD